MPIKKKFFSQKNGGHFEFSNFSQKLQNIKMLMLPLLDRVISTRFLTHRVSLQGSHASFQKNFILPKMAAILNFRIFAQKLQNAKMLVSRNRATQSDFNEIFDLQGISAEQLSQRAFTR